MRAENRVAALDGLRGVAILLVMFFHYQLIWPDRVFHLARGAAAFGWCGVDLFFVLSGFLITRILIDTKQRPDFFRRFYVRRLLRIFPLYYAVLTLLMASAPLYARVAIVLPAHPVQFFFYVNNWFDAWDPNLPHTFTAIFWSLAIEEQFYLIWPFCVWAIPNKNLWRVCVGGIVIAVLARFVLLWFHAPTEFIYRASITRMDALLIGALCAVIERNAWLSRATHGLLAASALFLLAAFSPLVLFHRVFSSPAASYTQSIGYTLIAAGFGCLILHLVREETRPLARAARLKLLVAIGRYSYGMYVYHLIVLTVVGILFRKIARGLVTSPSGAAFFVSLAGFLMTFLVARFSYHIYEKRFLDLKNRFDPSSRLPDVRRGVTAPVVGVD